MPILKQISVIGAVAAVLAVSATAAGVQPATGSDVAPAAATQRGPSITVVAAESRRLVRRLDVNGTIVPRQEAAVGVDLAGLIVDDLLADEGDRVEKGDVLAVLDRSQLDTQLAQNLASRAQAQASIEQARAQIADAEIGVRQAQEAYDRARELADKGIAARATLDNAVNALDSARARRLSAEKAVAASEAQIDVIDAQRAGIDLQIAKTEVRAPASGLVLSRSAVLGGIVSASAGPLFRIAVDGRFELSADVAETTLPELAVGMKAEIFVAGGAAPIDGELRRISPEVSRQSRLGTIRIALPDQSAARPGNFARAKIVVAERDGVAIPAVSVLYEGGRPFAQKVVEGVVHSVPVTLGTRDGDFVEVTEGLAAGDEIVARAGTFVADGDAITPVRAAAAQ